MKPAWYAHYFLLVCMILFPAEAFSTQDSTALIFPPYQVKLQTESKRPLSLNEHMTLVIDLEKIDPKAKDIDSFTFDARMPEHKHGMVTKAKVSKMGPLKFKIEGVRLHMPGKWVFDLDMQYDGGETKISTSYFLK